MIAKDMISNLVPPLKTSDTGDKALVWMHEFGVNQLPIVNGEEYLGLITEDDIMDLSEPNEPIGSYELSLQKASVTENAHLYEVIKTLVENRLTLVPVVGPENSYEGVVTLENIMKHFAELSSVNESGAVIVLNLNKNEYSLSEIARIVESNGALILSSHVFTNKEESQLEVVLKLNVSDIRSIVAAFERFEYTIGGFYQEDEYRDQIQDRFDSLMNYLNI
jgi:acetoin utilization protein AcuB